MATELACPVDFITVNENKIRLIAFNVLLLSIAYLFVPHWIIPAFLTVDFFLRGFNLGKYSALAILGEKEVQWFSIKPKPIDQAPKRFAAKIGFLFSAAIFIATIFNYNNTGIALAVIMALFAFLESVLGFCAGCYAYTFYIKILGAGKRQVTN